MATRAATNDAASASTSASGAPNVAYPRIAIRHDELPLFVKWLSLPHPSINIAAFKEGFHFPTPTPELEAEVAASITDEQKGRFAKWAQNVDIALARIILQDMRSKLMALLAELTTEMMDTLDLNEDEAVARLDEDMTRREGRD